MQFNIFLSNTNSGAINAIIDEIGKRRIDGRRQILIVPDRYSLYSEKKVMERLGLESTFSIEVTSLDRLADSYMSSKKLKYLSKSAGIMLVQKILLENHAKLQCFGGAMELMGFCENLFETIMQLKSSGVSPQMLHESELGAELALQAKIADIAFIFECYNEAIKDIFIDSANKLDLLKDEIESDEELCSSDFYFANFSTITPQALGVIRELIQCVHSVNISLEDSLGAGSKEYPLALLQKLNIMAESLGISPKVFTVRDILSGARSAIQKNLGNPKPKRERKGEDIVFSVATDFEQEIEYLAKRIVTGTKSGMRYKDMSVSLANLEGNSAIVEKVFGKYGIPCFLDLSVSFIDTMPMQFLSAVLELVQGLSITENIIKIVSSPLMNIAFDDACDFINLVKEYDFWEDDYIKGFDIPSHKQGAKLEGIRTEIASIIKFFKSGKATNSIENYVKLIMEFLEHIDFEKKVEAFSLSLLKDSSTASLGLSLNQIPSKLKQLLDQCKEVMGSAAARFPHFVSILKMGIESTTVANAPIAIDSVFVGDLNASFFDDSKVMFFANCVEGAFPAFKQDVGLFLDSEIASMSTHARLEPTIRDANIISRAKLFQNILRNCEKQYFSYAISSKTKEEQKPAVMLQEIMDVFDFSGVAGFEPLEVPFFDLNLSEIGRASCRERG